jgi:hypothetical protein
LSGPADINYQYFITNIRCPINPFTCIPAIGKNMFKYLNFETVVEEALSDAHANIVINAPIFDEREIGDGERSMASPRPKHISVSTKNLCVTVKISDKEKEVLKSINSEYGAGKLTAIMGPSGLSYKMSSKNNFAFVQA